MLSRRRDSEHGSVDQRHVEHRHVEHCHVEHRQTESPLTRTRHGRQRLGMLGEDLAERHLVKTGHRVLARNWRYRDDEIIGELDLVVTGPPIDSAGHFTVAVVEVRTRLSGRAGNAAASIDRRKRRRLRRLTQAWLGQHPHDGPVRGDVICVDGGVETQAWVITHMRGVW